LIFMKKKALAVLLIVMVLSVTVVAGAKPTRTVEKRVFIHKVNPEKPAKPDKPGKPSGTDKEWYKYSGVHWAEEDLDLSYVVDLEGSGLDTDEAFEAIVVSFEEWDVETSTELFGEGVIDDIKAGVLDSFNGISFGLLDPGAIAVTTYWYYTDTLELVEADTEFNTYYQWSLSGESGTMDLQNIATHEFGHWLNLGDLYNKPAKQQTMYGYSTYGETSKQSIESGDIAGLELIYGP